MTATRTNSNGQERKTLANQLDRLDGILDGLDTALTGAVQEAVEQAVKQAVQAVLAEVLTNRELQEQLQQAAQPASPRGQKSKTNRLWQATTEAARQTVQKVKQFGRGVGMALLAAGGVVAGLVYAARAKIASAAVAAYRVGKSLIHRAGTALARLLPVYAFGGA
jgi:hypothetical protein